MKDLAGDFRQAFISIVEKRKAERQVDLDNLSITDTPSHA